MPEHSCGAMYWGNPKKCPGCDMILDLNGTELGVRYPGLPLSHAGASGTDAVRAAVDARREQELALLRAQWRKEKEQQQEALAAVEEAKAASEEAQRALDAANERLREVSVLLTQIEAEGIWIAQERTKNPKQT
jgi:multidrug efflux pump subunit AcrA (membrane-fusion protein)